MSGGSYDYLCFKMKDAANELMGEWQTPYRRAFGKLMLRCAEAMHDVEWVDSSDMSKGDDEEAIMKCISTSDVLRTAIEEAENVSAELRSLIKACKTVEINERS